MPSKINTSLNKYLLWRGFCWPLERNWNEKMLWLILNNWGCVFEIGVKWVVQQPISALRKLLFEVTPQGIKISFTVMWDIFCKIICIWCCNHCFIFADASSYSHVEKFETVQPTHINSETLNDWDLSTRVKNKVRYIILYSTL